MRAIDDPVQLAAGASVFRRALARRPVSAAASATDPPVTGPAPRVGRSQRPSVRPTTALTRPT